MKSLILSVIICLSFSASALATTTITIDTTGWTQEQKWMRPEALNSIANEIGCLAQPTKISGDDIIYNNTPGCFESILLPELTAFNITARVNSLISAGVISFQQNEANFDALEVQVRNLFGWSEANFDSFIQLMDYRMNPPYNILIYED